MTVISIFRKVQVLALSLLVGSVALAQGDGPRAYLLAPKNVSGISAKWLNMNQNIIPSGSVLVPGADIKVDVFPIGIFHTFSLGGRFAQVLGVFTPGSATASATRVPPSFPIPKTSLDASGFSDGFIGFKLGLIGAPALNAVEFAKAPMRFSLFGEARYWYSGSYESSKLFNLGTNRGTFQFGLPMAIPLNNKRNHATWLEISPSISFYGANNDPSRNPVPGSIQVQKVTQAPLFIVENHLSHNFTPKFWVVGNLRYQQGGQTSADDVKDNNTMSILGGGFGAGYQILPFLGAYADWGGIIKGDNGAKSNMFRLSITISYLNKKKLEAEVKAKAMAAASVATAPVVVASVDTDGDGINDENDRCPKLAGVAGSLGCPDMIIYYKRDEATLSAEDKANLDEVVTFMNNNPELNVILEGHTSTLGDEKYNRTLSEKRAKISVDYLISKGIDKGRLQSAGFGEQFPIGDNSIEEGRAMSRRTVIKVAQ